MFSPELNNTLIDFSFIDNKIMQDWIVDVLVVRIFNIYLLTINEFSIDLVFIA